MIDTGRVFEAWRLERERRCKEAETLDMLLDLVRPGSMIRVRLPAAEQIRKGWAEWSAYGTTY